MVNKRKIFIVSLIAVSVIAVILLPFVSGPDVRRDPSRTAEDRIVVIPLNGTVQEGQGGLFAVGGITPRLVYSQLERAAADQSIKGVVLRVESPGGSIAASQEIAYMIRDFEKPIVVSMADMAASGGYYISAYAQGIVAQPGTITGSIGVISTLMDLEGLYEILGIEVETIKSGKHKDMFNRALTEEERVIMQNFSDEAYDQFVGDVAEGRGMTVGEVRELATGEIYLGSRARDLGLVDRLGGTAEAIDYLAELNDLEKPVRYEFPAPSVFDQFFTFGFQVFAKFEKALLGPELIKLEMLREGVPPDIRYQLR